MEFKDYYKILGISKTARESEIKAAYRQLARKHHPDLNPGDKLAESRIKSINEAYEVLGDPEKRKKYDEVGSDWEEILRNREQASKYTQPGFQWQTKQDFDMGDFFESFFGEHMGRFGGGGRTRTTRGSFPGDNVEAEIDLSLEDLAQGGKKSIRISSYAPCPQCRGQGVVAAPSQDSRGRGGQTILNACPSCQGRGQRPVDRTLKVSIPKGLTDGSRLRLAGQGGKGLSGGRNGDLYLRIKTRPHRNFRLDRYDLHAELPLYDYEATLGAKTRVPTLTGPVQLTIPPETQSGGLLRLKGKGLSKAGGKAAGDLYFHVSIRIPQKLTERERELYRELKQSRGPRNNGDRFEGI